jgi:EAL domain-containing protein (putative c-di-GMP-specific phosphodiesterase class I)
VAVNVSGRQLEDPLFEAVVAEILADTQLPPNLLELEVTEGAMMKDVQASAAILAKIRARGVRIAVDDFGTGYSSLSCLARLPVDTLKIDRSFVRELGSDGVSASIVVAILALSKALSLRVVAEGVETAEHATALQRYGCDEAQGYLYARPMPAEECAAWIAARSSVARVHAPHSTPARRPSLQVAGA